MGSVLEFKMWFSYVPMRYEASPLTRAVRLAAIVGGGMQVPTGRCGGCLAVRRPLRYAVAGIDATLPGAAPFPSLLSSGDSAFSGEPIVKAPCLALATVTLVAALVGCQESSQPTTPATAGSSPTASSAELTLVTLKVPNMT